MGEGKQGFQYIQEYTGFVSPGIFAMFLLGFFWKKTTSAAALFATIGGFFLSILFKFLPAMVDLSPLYNIGFAVPNAKGVYDDGAPGAAVKLDTLLNTDKATYFAARDAISKIPFLDRMAIVYEGLVENLQKEMKAAGFTFGVIEEHSFNNIVVEMHGNDPVFLGQEESSRLFDYLILKGYINKVGKVQDTLKDDLLNDAVVLPEVLEEHVQKQIINKLKETAGKLEIKRNEEKQVVRLNKLVLLSPEFKEQWDKIKYNTPSL